MTGQESPPHNWVQILATLFLALAAICFPVWAAARGSDPHGGFMIVVGGVLFSAIGGILWFLGTLVRRQD